LNDALQIYTASLRGSLNQDFVEIFPDVDSNELEAIVPAIERVLLEMSRDPLWGGDYRSDLAIEDGGTDT